FADDFLRSPSTRQRSLYQFSRHNRTRSHFCTGREQIFQRRATEFQSPDATSLSFCATASDTIFSPFSLATACNLPVSISQRHTRPCQPPVTSPTLATLPTDNTPHVVWMVRASSSSCSTFLIVTIPASSKPRGPSPPPQLTNSPFAEKAT